MPRVFKVGPYLVYFWLDEGAPLEPLHVHVSEGVPQRGATKVWITQKGKCLLANNDSQIPDHVLRNVMEVIEARSAFVEMRWLSKFGQVSYYC